MDITRVRPIWVNPILAFVYIITRVLREDGKFRHGKMLRHVSGTTFYHGELEMGSRQIVLGQQRAVYKMNGMITFLSFG